MTNRCGFILLVILSSAKNMPCQGVPVQEIAPAIAIPKPQSSRNCRFRQLHFSPDGRYILAQHASGVAVLTLEPFGVLFQRSAENVSISGFTPDSQQIWLVSKPSHVVTPEIEFA